MSSPRSTAGHVLNVLAVLVFGFVYVTLLSLRSVAVMCYRGLTSARSASGSVTHRFRQSGSSVE